MTYTWRQQLLDSGQVPWMASTDHAELVAARRSIAELENELAIHRRVAELPVGWAQKAVRGDCGNGLRGPASAAGRPPVLGVSESGYYEWRGRVPSLRAVRHA